MKLFKEMTIHLPLFLGSIPHTSAIECSINSIQSILSLEVTALRALILGPNSTFGDVTEIAYPKNSSALPALCVLTINVTSSPTSSFRFGLFLPEEWNGRFAAVGNGGLAGGINWPAMGTMVKYGFAVVSTDTGHNGTSIDGRFALQGRETIVDNAYRALHGSIVHAKDIVSQYYRRKISFSYYNGCSTGGRQGLLELQMFPGDFDGILAGAPAWESNKIAPWMVQMGSLNLPNNSAHHIPPSLFPLIQAEVMRQCDPIDGIEDGIISDPQACHFRPETLHCASENQNASACLNGQQINTLHLLYGDYYETEKPLFFHPLSYGAEPSWPVFLPPNAPLNLGVNALAYLAFRDPDWDWRTLNYSLIQWLDAEGDRTGIPEKFGEMSKFRERGGKLIHWHGLSDSLVPWQSSRTFYETALRNLSSASTSSSSAGIAGIDDFYRLFFVPGMLHCNNANGDAPWYFGAGSGPEALGSDVYSVPGNENSEHDAVLALMQWVEEGVAPAHIVATKFVGETVSMGVRRQRKLCAYPKSARFVAAGGDVDVAESWVCE